MTTQERVEPSVRDFMSELRSIRAGMDARVTLNSNWGCTGCGKWNPHGHQEGHGHDDDCPEMARVIAESSTRQRLDALLAEHDATVQSQGAEIERLRTVVERLGSMEAFTTPRTIKGAVDDELLARIDFARATLTQPTKAPK